MSERPELNKGLDAITFRSFYYLKQELVNFCRENGPGFGQQNRADEPDRILSGHGKGAEIRWWKEAYCNYRHAH